MKSNPYQCFPYMNPDQQDRTPFPDLGDRVRLPEELRPCGCKRIPEAMPIQKTGLYPFYYPLDTGFIPQFGYDFSADSEKDLVYVKQLYPAAVRSIQTIVEREVDRLEYEGIPIFDEYPDKESLYLIADRIYQQKKTAKQKQEADCSPDEKPENGEQDEFQHYIILVLLYHEILQRRKNHRSRMRWW